MMQELLQNNAAAPIFFAMNLCIAAGGALFARALFPGRPFLFEKIASFGLISYAAIVIITTLCGASGRLDTLSAAVCAIVFFAAGTAANFIVFRLNHPLAHPAALSAAPAFPSFAQLVIAALLTLFALVLVWGILTPPPPWDAFVYHLTFPARWIQEGRIFPVTVPFGDQAGTYFPSNTELYYAWLMLPLRSDMLTNAGQLPFLALMALCVWNIACRLGAGANAAAVSALLASLLPGAFRQAAASEVDIIFAALFLSSICFLFTYMDTSRKRQAAGLAGLAAGLFIGTKYIGLSFGPLLVLPAFFAFIKRKDPKNLLLYTAAALAGGGYWYARNWMLTGNPIFPLAISFAGLEVLPGGYPRESMTYAVFHARSFQQWLDAMLVTTGVPLGLLLTAGSAASLAALAAGWRRFRMRGLYLLPLPAVIISMFAFMVPYNLESRFTYSAWALAAAAFAILIDSKIRFVRVIAALAAAAAIATSVATNDFLISLFANYFAILSGMSIKGAAAEGFLSMLRPGALMLLGGCAALAAGGAAASFLHGKKDKTAPAAITAASLSIASALFVFAVGSTLPHYRQYRNMYHPDFKIGAAWRYLDDYQKRFGPDPANIAFTGTDLSFGLFGGSLQNKVIAVPVTENSDWKFHDCASEIKQRGEYRMPRTDRIDFCRRGADINTWVSNLAAERADFLVVARLHQNDYPHIDHDAEGFPVELFWAESNPKVFRLIYSNPVVKVFRLAPVAAR